MKKKHTLNESMNKRNKGAKNIKWASKQASKQARKKEQTWSVSNPLCMQFMWFVFYFEEMLS